MRAPDDLPPPLARRAARTVAVELETVELLGQLADGTTYRYWTFDGKVPGPMLRVRVGDTRRGHDAQSATTAGSSTMSTSMP